jgi:hypothetical protein
MRINSIISILRKRKEVKKPRSKRIKYAEALIALKAYQNSELKLTKMIDNVFTPSKSISPKCQLEGCGMNIRYEYILQSKVTDEIIIAGSTCVWVMLGLSEEQIKDFRKVESSIKDFHDMLSWRKDNMDVWEKLKELRKANISKFKPFWEEVEFCRLHPEDERYIRGIDVSYEIKRVEDWKNRNNRPAVTVTTTVNPVQSNSNATPFANIISNIAGTVPTPVTVQTTPQPSKNNHSITGETDENYEKVLVVLKKLTNKHSQNVELKAINTQEESGTLLTMNQIHKIKVEANKDFFETHIKGIQGEEIIYESCDQPIIRIFTESVNSKVVRMYSEDIIAMNDARQIVNMIRKYKKQFNTVLEKFDKDTQKFWRYFRIKHEVILK